MLLPSWCLLRCPGWGRHEDLSGLAHNGSVPPRDKAFKLRTEALPGSPTRLLHWIHDFSDTTESRPQDSKSTETKPFGSSSEVREPSLLESPQRELLKHQGVTSEDPCTRPFQKGVVASFPSPCSRSRLTGGYKQQQCSRQQGRQGRFR